MAVGMGILSEWDWSNNKFAAAFAIFVAVSTYVALSSLPYYRRLTFSLANSKPREMTLVPKLYSTGCNHTHHDWGADLFLDPNHLEGKPEISIDRLLNNEDLKKLKPQFVVKVYGADQNRGAILIETEYGLMWPRSSASVHRKDQILAY